MAHNSSPRSQKLLILGCGGVLAAGLVLGLVLVVVLAFWWSARSQTQAIERVLAADQASGQQAKSVTELVRNMEAIDLSGCPTDFKEAYIAHIGAWSEMATVAQEAQQFGERYGSWSAMAESFMRGMVFDFGMTGEANAARDRIQAQNRKASADIYSTWTTVKQIAVQHGADVHTK